MSTGTTLAPCPFCGGAMRVQSNRDWHRLFGDHDDDCVWGQDDDAVMMVPAQPNQLAAMVHAWNRRATISAPEHWAVVAWMHEEDPRRVISADQREAARRDGGASWTSVRAYTVPLVRRS